VGDGILAYFGYPVAHEDAAARAIHAGLAIVDAFGAPDAAGGDAADRLNVRIGIATGQVVVGDLTGHGAELSTAMGETPNLAARLQSLAGPNQVIVASATRDLAGGQFEYDDGGMHELKGFGEAVRAYRVLGTSDVESRFDAARGLRLTSIVGRDGEMELLRDRWARARAGKGQVVLISGEAGIGKSRIADALLERVIGEPHIRLRYQCSPYHANSPLHPFLQQLERAADFRRGDTAEQKMDKLQALLDRSENRGEEREALYAAMLSIPLGNRDSAPRISPQQLKDKSLAALLERIAALAAQAPVLLVFEDAHWVDPTSAEVLHMLAAHAKDLPLLAIVTSRARADESWLAMTHVSWLQLERLDRRQAALMVDGLLPGRAVSAVMVEQILSKSDGVPLFIEELVKGVEAAQGTASDIFVRLLRAEVPATLQDSLMARLDQLGSAKKVAQVGAVIGREFARDLVAAVASFEEAQLTDALQKLAYSTVVYGRGRPPWSTFTFKHALLQDAAYASLLRATRQDLHARVAEALERMYPERLRIEPEIVAHHYTQAGRPMQGAGYWAAAGQRALERSANEEAWRHASKGLETLAAAPESEARDRLELGLEILRGAAARAVKGFASSHAERSFARARDLSEKLGDFARLIDAHRGLFSCYYARGTLAQAGAQAREVAALGERIGDPNSLMLSHWMLGCVSFWQGEFGTARRELDEAYALYDPTAQRTKTLAMQIDPGVNALVHQGWVLSILGQAEEAVRTSEKALAAARALSQPFAVAMALYWGCAARSVYGQHGEIRPLLDELHAVTTEHQLRYLGTGALILEAQELVAQGECAAALDHVARALREFEEQEAMLGLPFALSIAASAHAALGNAKDGLAALATAFEWLERNGDRHWEAELWRLKGTLHLLPPANDADEARACFRRAIEVARRQGAKAFERRAAEALARLEVAHQ
jgi:tetratricopeptide (TPR) repeat protein